MYNQIILIGILVSILFTEITGLSPAGLIVPGYMALSLRTPERIIYTLLVALVAFGISRVLNNFFILYGRRRFAMMILLSYCVDLFFSHMISIKISSSMIGVLVPGIIASEFEKQGILPSIISLGIAVGMISMILFICGYSLFPI